MTGTADTMPGFVDDWRLHLAAFDAAPRAFAMIVDGMDHYFRGAFGRLSPGDGMRDAAVDALNAGVVEFVEGCVGEGGLSAQAWTARTVSGISRLAHAPPGGRLDTRAPNP
ncbi:MAG TPA: hypothetical protein VMQ93_18020 [Novosphingobium sp.]|nr:hypothetical protein [Novosphingobium sp.]